MGVDDSAGAGSSSGKPYSEHRAVPRYNLIATAEIVDAVSAARMSGRISEISRKGCYVDILNTLPIGTLLQVSISRDRGTFTSPGRIIYAQEGMGMGVAFLNPPSEQLSVLDSWLAEISE
jgi:PilZ domain